MGIVGEQVIYKVRKYAQGKDTGIYDVHRYGMYVATLRPFTPDGRRSKCPVLSAYELTSIMMDYLEDDPGREVLVKAKGKVVAILRNELED